MARPTTRAAPLDYPRVAPGAPGANAMDELLRALAPSGASRDLVALFEGRASRTAIDHWRKGERAIPDWAIAMIGQKAKSAASSLVAPLQRLKNPVDN